MANQVIGTIVSIGQTQSLTAKSGNAFQKRDVVISVRRFDPNTGEPVTDWENTPKLSFMGERCRDLDRFQVGQAVIIYFDLQGRKYENANKEIDIITEARPYKIELYGQRPAQQPMPTAQPAPANPYPQQPQTAQAPQPAPQQQQYVQPQPGYQDPFPRS